MQITLHGLNSKGLEEKDENMFKNIFGSNIPIQSKSAEKNQIKRQASKESQENKQKLKIKLEEVEVESNESYIITNSPKLVRTGGFTLLGLLLGVMFAYGFGSSIESGPFTNTENFYLGIGVFTTSIFIVLGYGLVLSYYNQTSMQAIFIALFTVSFNILLSPLLEKFWFNAFINSFSSSTTPTTGINNQIVIVALGGQFMKISYTTLKISLICSISQMVVYIGVIGRIQIYKTIFMALVFTIFWNLNYFLCLLLLQYSPDPRFYDDYAVNMVYVFAGGFGLLIAMDVKSYLTLESVRRPHKQFSKIFAMLGIFFIYLSFCLTSSITGYQVSSSTTHDRGILYPEGSMGMFFALSASVITTYAMSIILNKGDFRIRITDAFFGTISGGIIYGPIAGTVSNLGAPIALGIIAGLVSTIYKAKIWPQLNKVNVYDSMGLFGSILFVSILGTFVASPIANYIFYKYQLLGPGFDGVTALTSAVQTSFLLIYVGISLGVGLTGGLFASLFLRCSEQLESKFGDALTFVQQLNLKDEHLDVELFDLEESMKSKSYDEIESELNKKKNKTKQRANDYGK